MLGNVALLQQYKQQDATYVCIYETDVLHTNQYKV
jgi:hypothetical protein